MVMGFTAVSSVLKSPLSSAAVGTVAKRGHLLRQAQSLVAEVKESSILYDRPADRPAEIVAAIRRFGSGLRKEIRGIEFLIAEELECRPMNRIRAGFRDHDDLPARAASIFGGVYSGEQLEFLNIVYGWPHRR